MTAEPAGKRPRNSYHVADDGRIKMIGLTSEETTEFEILLRYRSESPAAPTRTNETATELRMLELHLKHHRALENWPSRDIRPLADVSAVKSSSSHNRPRMKTRIIPVADRRTATALYIVGAISIGLLFLLAEFLS